MQTSDVEAVFDSLSREEARRYMDYWESITPQDAGEIFQRFLFAFCSVRTSWQNNVRGYQAIKEYPAWLKDRTSLLGRLKASRSGMEEIRTSCVWEFSQRYWKDPYHFWAKEGESYGDWRNRLVKEIRGLSYTKVSFALEMIQPNTAQVCCLDTHMLQLYRVPQARISAHSIDRIYPAIEADWITRCHRKGIPPFIARSLYWNSRQNQENCRYWSYVLEKE